MTEPGRAHIVYAADECYAPVLGVSLASLFANSRDMEEIVLYVMDGGISETNRRRIESVCMDYGRPLPCWISMERVDEVLKMHVDANRGSSAQYARIFIGRHVHAERALYLDCDVMFRKSVRELWNLDLGGRTAAMLADAVSTHYRESMELSPGDTVFNPGVMLVDLCRWRESDAESRALDCIRRYRGKPPRSDLGAVNSVLSRDTCRFEARFNAITAFYDFSCEELIRFRRPVDYYSAEELKTAVEDPSIVHFTSSFLSPRPWETGCGHPFAAEWQAYRNRGPWRSEPVRCSRKPLYCRVLAAMPRPVMLRVYCFLHTWLRPEAERRGLL